MRVGGLSKSFQHIGLLLLVLWPKNVLLSRRGQIFFFPLFIFWPLLVIIIHFDLVCHQKKEFIFASGMLQFNVHTFLDFCCFNFRFFQFNEVYDSHLFSSPLVLLSNHDLHGFCFPRFFMCPHINSVNRGMSVQRYKCDFKKIYDHYHLLLRTYLIDNM